MGLAHSFYEAHQGLAAVQLGAYQPFYDIIAIRPYPHYPLHDANQPANRSLPCDIRDQTRSDARQPSWHDFAVAILFSAKHSALVQTLYSMQGFT